MNQPNSNHCEDLQNARLRRRRFIRLSVAVGAILVGGSLLAGEKQAQSAEAPAAETTAAGLPLYVYTIAQDGTREAYDEAMAVACLQGVINRNSPTLYVLSKANPRPQYWLNVLTKEGRWLQGRQVRPLADLDGLVELAGGRLKGAVIWDPAVPATINVATTIAGIADGVVFSPEYADRYLKRWNLPILKDLRGMFTGAETGSKKNDAYRWAIREYLEKGLCSSTLLCLFEDSYSTRQRGDASYVVTRDWAVKRRAFVFDLSPWGDEQPQDDPKQTVGLDLETYRMVLVETLQHSAGRHMTELTGFFAFSKYSNMPDHKSRHDGVPTEWESVWLMSPYNCYQNTMSSNCFNQSLHSQAPWKPLKQRHAEEKATLEKKAYLCFLMADYDSTGALYDFFPTHWDDANRGKVPLAWGIDPNLIETYPDVISHAYNTATDADTFTSDASAAGYMNPNRIAKEYLPLFVKHNRHFFQETDMSIAAMVLDRDQPSPDVKDAFAQFAPHGFATIVDPIGTDGRLPEPQIWKGMPITELINDTCETGSSEQIAQRMSGAITARGNKQPGLYFFRVTYVSPTTVTDAVSLLRRNRPELDIEVVGPNTFFSLLKEQLASAK